MSASSNQPPSSAPHSSETSGKFAACSEPGRSNSPLATTVSCDMTVAPLSTYTPCFSLAEYPPSEFIGHASAYCVSSSCKTQQSPSAICSTVPSITFEGLTTELTTATRGGPPIMVTRPSVTEQAAKNKTAPLRTARLR